MVRWKRSFRFSDQEVLDSCTYRVLEDRIRFLDSDLRVIEPVLDVVREGLERCMRVNMKKMDLLGGMSDVYLNVASIF